MADSDLSEGIQGGRRGSEESRGKANEISGDEIKSFIEAVKTKLGELENLLDDQRVKHSSS